MTLDDFQSAANCSRAPPPTAAVMGGIEIRWMSDGELTAACHLIGLAFADNPNTLAIARGDQARAERMMQAAVRVAKLGRTCSHVLVAGRAGRLVGVLNAAEWPNCQLRTSEKLRTAPAMIRAMGLGPAEGVQDEASGRSMTHANLIGTWGPLVFIPSSRADGSTFTPRPALAPADA
jgi:hypothetical protein